MGAHHKRHIYYGSASLEPPTIRVHITKSTASFDPPRHQRGHGERRGGAAGAVVGRGRRHGHAGPLLRGGRRVLGPRVLGRRAVPVLELLRALTLV